MKRLVRFVLLTLGYLIAVVRVAARLISRPRKSSKLSRRRLGMISGSALALLGLVIAGNLLSPPAYGVTIRSSTGSDACTVDVGNAAYANVSKNGDYCVVTVTTSTAVTLPSYVNTIGIVVVGGGGGGGTDGGAGGSGGETRYSAAQGVAAGGTATVTVGAGGAGAVWSAGAGANGSPTTVSGAGLSYTANGGYVGGGWNSCSIRYGSAGGSGGTGGTSATGGTGGNGTLNGCPSSGGFSSGGTGGNGPYISTISGINASYFAGGGGGGTCLGVGTTYSVTGAAGGAAGGGRGTDYTANVGATAGFAGTPNTGGGGGAGAACDWSNADYNGSTERTPGGAGGSGVVVMSWQENRTSVSQAPDGCLYNVAEACLQAAKIQLTNAQGSNLATAGVTVSLVSTSTGTLAGTLSATTDSNGLATLGSFWLTGAAIGSTPTLTFEAVGYRNVQSVITMKGYAETLNVVSGSTDTNGSFFGTTGTWLATSTSSNLSATTLQNELTARDVTLRASAASSSNASGDILWSTGATVTETASSSRVITLKSTRNIFINGSARVTSSGQPLNIVAHTDSDGTNGGTFHMDGAAAAYVFETNGGSVAIGGGSSTTTWNSMAIPSSYAGGYAAYTGSWWGVELGVNTDIANSKLIATGGGKVRINGYSWASPTAASLYGISWESGRIDTGSGDIDLIGGTNGSPSSATNDNWGIGIGTNHVTVNDRPVLVTSGTATLNGSLTAPGSSNYYWGVAIGYSNITTGAGGFNVTSSSRSIIWADCAFIGPTNLSGTSASLSGTNTFAGNVTVTATAGDISASGSQTLNTSAAALNLKATGNVLVETSTTLQTSAGNVTLWSDTDGTTSRGGGVKTGAGSSIVSNGGAISLSGGTANTTSWAKGTSTSGDAGVWISGAVNAGSGNIVIRGEEAATTTGSNDRAGVFIDQGASITATGTGAVTIDGKVDATNANTGNYHYGVWVGNASTTSLGVISTASGAISVKGDASSNSQANRRGVILNRGKLTSTGGTVTVDAVSGTSATGTADIYFVTDTNTIESDTGAVLVKGSVGATSLFDSGTISSNNSVTLQISKPAVNSAKSLTLGGSGEKVIEYPVAATDFAADVDTARFAFGSTSKSIRIGTASVTKALTVTSAIAAAGPISLLANSVKFIKAAGLNTSALAGSAILVKTKLWIQTDSQDSASAATKFVTDNGDITFWTASAGGTDGSILTGNYTFFDTTNGDLGAQATGGGRITFGGGSASSNGVPTGPTLGGTNTVYPIYIYAYNRFYSGGGDIWMYGKSASGDYHGYIANSDLVIDSGQGQITLRGDNNGAEWALSLGNDNSGDVTVVSEKTSGNAIDISGNSTTYAPLIINRGGTTNTAYIAATGGGAINLTGNATTSYVGVAVDRSQIVSSSGKITLDGGVSYASLGYQSRGEVYLGSKAGSPYVTTSTADILVKGTTYVDSDNTTTMAAKTGGNVVVESAGTNFTSASNWGLTTTAGSFRFGKSTETQDLTVSAAVSASVVGSSTGTVSVNGNTVTVSAAMQGTSIAIAPKAAYSGAGALTATAGTLTISGGTTVKPTGSLRATGNITLSGSSQGYYTGITIASSAGSISMTAGPYAGHALQIQNSTVSTATQPLTLTGTSTAGDGIYLQGTNTISTTSGVINITGVGTDWGIFLETADIISSSGNINVDAGVRGVVDGYGTTTNFGALSGGSATGNITVLGDRQWSGSTKVNYRTRGAVVLNSKASNYIEAPVYVNHTFAGCSSVSISNIAATWEIDIGMVGDIAGPYVLQGQYVKLTTGSILKTSLGKSSSGTRNNGILVKATDRIYVVSSNSFETTGADITLWPDSDGSGVGAIYLEGSNVFTSRGGDITMAGGLDDGAVNNTEIAGRTSGDGYPDNYAAGVNGLGENAGVDLVGGHQLLSAGGDIFIAGRGSALNTDNDMGVSVRGGLIYSAAGKIAIYGKSPGDCQYNWHRGIFTGYSASTHIISDSTATDAIYLYGNTASCNNGWSVYASAIQGANGWSYIAAPSGGGIKVYGIQGSASYYNAGTMANGNAEESDILQLNYVNLIANSGPISVNAVTATTSDRWALRFATRGNLRSYIGSLASDIATNFPAYPTLAAVASTSDVTLKADSICPYLTTFKTSGNVSLIPETTFSTVNTMFLSSDWGTEFPTKVASLTIGAPGTSGLNQTKANIDLKPVSAVGAIKVYGADLTFEGDLSSDATTGTGVLLKSTKSITTLRSVTTLGGDVVLWSRAGSLESSTDEGKISLENGASISTSGGDIIMAGSTMTDTDGYPMGHVYFNSGAAIYLGTAGNAPVNLASANGLIRIYSKAGPSAGQAIALVNNASAATISSGIGRQEFNFIGSGTGDNVFETWGPITFSSSADTGTDGVTPAIKFYVNQTNSSNGFTPIQQQASYLHKFVAVGAGGLDVTVTSANTGVYAIDYSRAFNFLAASGKINLNFGVNGLDLTSTTASGFVVGALSGSSSSSNIAITGDRFNEAAANATASAMVARTSGAVAIKPASTSFGSAQTFDSTWSFPGITGVNGDYLAGLTFGAAGNTAALTLNSAFTIAGPIAVYGGDVTNSANLTATGSTGSIAINSNGLFTNSAGISSAGGNQPTTIKADKAALTGSITSGTGIATITGFTTAKTIDLGLTGDTTSTLALTNTELGTITAGTIRVGDPTSGTITVSQPIAIDSAKSATIAIRTAGNVTASGTGALTATNIGIAAGGTISLGGSNVVSGSLAIVASGASAGSGVSFGGISGAFRPAAVDGITPVYGIGKYISITSAPAIGATEVRYLNQTWSAPPKIFVKDAYGYDISTANNTASTYTTTVTGSGSPTIAGATPVVSGGTQTFSSLNFTTTAGTTALTFTTAGLASGGTSAVTTGTYDVQGGEPQTIAIAYTSTSAPARKIGFGLTATLKDLGGNTVSGPHATDSITVSVADGDADATNNATFISGNSPSTVAGVADFSNLKLSGKVATNYTLTFSVTYLDSTSVSRTKTASQVVTLTPGDAAKLGITTQAAGFVNRTNFATQPVVAIQDADGNTVTTATNTVAVAVTAASGSSTQGLTGTTSVAALSGVATFAGLGKTGQIGDKVLTFSTGSLTSATQPFTLTFGAANKLTMSSPATTVNDTVFATQPIVTIQDEDGNTVADSTARVTLTSDATIGGNLMNSSVAMDALAGVANFSGKNVKLTGTIGAKNLTATITGGITVTNSVTITYGAATRLSVTRQAAGAVNGVNFTTQPQVTVQDISGNTVANSSAAISVASSGAVLAGTSPVNATSGVATFAGLNLTGTATTYTLTFTSGSLTSDPQPITLVYGAAHHLAVTTAAAGAVNGVAFTTQPVITIQDQSNNTVANLSSTVTVASSGSVLSSNNSVLTVNAVNGIATFANALKLTGVASTYTLTYSISAPSALTATQQIIVTPGAATHLALTTQAAGFVNRADFTTAPAVSIEDASGNVVTTATDNVTVSLGAGTGNLTGTTTVAAVGGVATFTGLGKNGTVGLKTMTFHTGSLTDATQQFTLTFGAAYQLAKTTPAAGFTNAVAFTTQPKITIQDQDGNTVSDSTATVTVTSSPAGLGGTNSMAAVAGVANFSGKGIKLTGTVGDYTLTYAIAGPIAETQAITLTYGSADHLTLTTQAAGAVNRAAFTTQPVVEVRDVSNNVVANSTLQITAASSVGATIGGTASRTAAAGVADFDLNSVKTQLYGAVGNYTITYSATSVTAATQSLNLTYGVATQLAMTSPATSVNDTVFGTQPIVTIQDRDGNTVENSTATVTLTSNDAALSGSLQGGAVAMDAVAGVANFSGKNVKLTGIIGARNLIADAAGLTGATNSVTITYGVATQLALTTQPSGFVNRTTFTVQPVVKVQDVSGNTVANSTIAINASIDSGSLAGTAQVNAIAGVATFSGLGANGVIGDKVLTFKDAAEALTPATKTFTLAHGAAHHLALSVASNLVNDTEFGTQPIVTIYDFDGNVVTTGSQSTQTVTLAATGATLGGTKTMAAVAGVANFSGHSLKLTGLIGAKTLTAAIASPSSITRPETVTVTYGAADHLALATAAAGASNGAAFTTQPVVEVRDVSENVVANSTAQVTASVNNGTLLGSTQKTAVAGVATFTDLGLTATAGTKVLTFASTDITSIPQNILAVTGAPTQLRIDVAGTLVNNTAFAAQPVVTLLDATNTVVSFGAYSTQTVTLSSPDATIAGTLAVDAVAGVADFAGKGIKLTGVVGAHNLRASIGSPSIVTQTVPVTITFGAAHHLRIASGAAGAANRIAFTSQPAIEVLDISDNRVADSTATISVTASGANGAVLGGDTSMSAVAGVAYFNQNTNPLKLTGRVGSYSLAYASTGLTGASESIALTHGVATQIALTQNAAGAKSGQAFTTQPALEVRDADGNLVDTGAASTLEIKVTTGAANYDASTHTGANLTGPANSDVVTASAGIATFAGLRLEGVAASAYGLTFTTQNAAVYNGLTATQNIALTAGTETHLSVVQQPTAIIAGAAFSPAVKAEILDAWNNRVLDAANTVTIKPTLVADALASNVLDSSKSAVANSSGLVTFTGLTFTKAGTQFIQFSSTGLIAATSTAFAITNAAAHHLTWITSPVGAKNDYAIKGAAGADPELEIRDQYENPVLTGAATSVAVTEPTSSTDVISISGGSAHNTVGSARVIFSNLVLRAKVGGYTLRFTAANGSLPINGTYIDSNSAVAITFGDPSALRLTRAAAGANAGAPFTTQPALNIEDTAGNVVADSALEVTVSENETQVLSGTQAKAAASGVVDFSGSGLKLTGAVATGLTLKYAVTYNSSEISTTQQIDLNPGLAVRLTIGQQPTTVKTRVAFNPVPTVVLRDASGNQVTTDSSSTVTAQLKDSTGYPVGNETAAFSASGGLVTFTGLAFQAPSTANYYLTFKLTSNSEAVTSNPFDILPGVATELRITQQPSTLTPDNTSGKTGELLSSQPEVKLYDQDGNLVTTANSGVVTIRVKSTDGAGDLREGDTTANITGGIATFAGVKFVGTPDAIYTLDFATSTPNPALTSLASSPISVTHNDATHLVLTSAASGGRSGQMFDAQPVVTIKDRYENTVTSGPDAGADITTTGEITAPLSGVSNPSNETATASDGVARFRALGLTGLISNTYKLNFNIIGSSTVSGVSQPNVTISYGSANHLALTTDPVGGNATGQLLATQPVVEVRDGAGNRVANSALSIRASIVSTSGLVLADGSAARLTGSSKAAVAGVSSFNALALFGLPGAGYTLKFDVVGLGFATSNPIQVLHAAAHHLTITQQPTGGNATGSNLAGQPIVQLRDAFQNVVSADSTDVIAARLSTTSARERLEGSATVTLAQGVGAFAGLKVVALPDTDYTLNFTTTIGGTTFTSDSTIAFRVTYSTPTKLAIAQQPSGGTTGVALNTQPIVEVQDVYGNRVYNYAGNVAASVATGATLTNSSVGNSSLSMAVTAGQAVFTGLALTGTPATDYQLTFASGALTSINSSNIRVVPGAPVRIVVLNQPIGAETGSALAGQPVVEIQDSFGNRVTQESSTVITAALTSGAGGTLTRVVSSNSVAVTATTVNGVATFSNLYMRGLTNRNYRMTFSSGQLVVAESADYTVHHAAVSSLVWATQPAVGMTGSALTRAAVLQLQDLDGNVADTDNSTVVTAAITTGIGGSIVNYTATARNGVVTFANLTLTGTPGVSYKLTFTGVIGSTVVSAEESAALTPTHAVPDKVTMQVGRVTGGLSGQDLTSQPTLFVRDRFNNIATSDNSTVVTASILNDATGSVSGNVTATAVNGAVTFAGLKVAGTPGTEYKLSFAANWSGATLFSTISDTFTVSKIADVSLSYAAQDYVPNGNVPAVFNTDSPGAITFTTNASSLVCELDPGTGDLTIKGAGDCTVRVEVDADPLGFYLANSAEATLVISKAQQAAVLITSAATVDYWSSLNPVATGGSGNGSISYSIVAGSYCRLIGATILPGDAGSLCQLTATRSGDSNYQAATSAVQTIVVRKINQAPLSMASAASMSVDSLALFTAGGSGSGLVSYSMVSAGTAHCTVSGSTLSATAAGTCSVRATKAASTNYNTVTSLTQVIRVTKDEQTVAFTSTAPMYPVVAGSYTPAAVATSGLPVTYSIATNSAGASCAFDTTVPSKINFTATGVCEVVATQAGSGRYAAASVRQIIRVGLLNQTIVFDAIPDLTFGTPAFKLLPTTNAGANAVIALSTTANSTACSLAGNIVTLTAAGYCEISATQSGYGSYAAATEVVRGFNVLADLAGAPHIFSTSVTTHALTASFTAPSYTGGSAITGYALIATDANGVSYENAACPVGTSNITCTIVGLPNDLAYTAVARAITSAGRGAVSNATAAQTPIDAPMAVTNLATSTSNNDLVVTWAAPTALDGTFLRYDIFVAPIGSSFPATTPYNVTDVNATSTTIANILNQATASPSPTASPSTSTASARIAFRRASVSAPSPSSAPSSIAPAAPVTPTSSAGFKVQIVTITSSSSAATNANTTSAMQTNFAVPLSPSQLTLTVTGSDLMASWSAPTSDGGSALTGYDVKVNGVIVCPATTSLFCAVSGLQPGRTYAVEVLAINAVGFSAASQSSHSVPALPVVPGAGSNLNSSNGMTVLSTSVKTVSTKGGQLLTLHARNFAGVTDALLDGKQLKIVSNSEDHITLEMPAHAAGPVDLTFRSKVGTLIFQEAVRFVAPPRADVVQQFSRYRAASAAVNQKMVASIEATLTAAEKPKAMICLGLVSAKYTANDVRLAKLRAQNVCAIGSRLDGNLAVRSTTAVTKLTGPAARAVKVTYKY